MIADTFAQSIKAMREHECTKGPSGNWLCKCGALVEGDFATTCPSCIEKERAAANAEALRRREAEFVERTRSLCDPAFEALPAWEHLRDETKFLAAVTHPGMRSIASKWGAKRSVLALGPSGVGKSSSLARALLSRRSALEATALAIGPAEERRAACVALSRLSSTRWITASEIVRTFRGHRLGAGECPALTRLVEAPVLVVDELGPESSHYTGELFDIVDRRYAKQRPTAVTSGLTVAEFKAKYGDAFFRRITGEGVGSLIDAHPRGSLAG